MHLGLRYPRTLLGSLLAVGAITAATLSAVTPGRAAPPLEAADVSAPAARQIDGKVAREVARDESQPLSAITQRRAKAGYRVFPDHDRGPMPTRVSGAFQSDPAKQTKISGKPRVFPIANFEGVNLDDQASFGGGGYPPDPNGDVGRNHYVQMVNTAVAIYTKSGDVALPPTPLGALWDGFEVEDCTDLSGDPIVVYDQFADRWILSQFTTRGPEYFNCVAVSATSDPTGAYYRYAFTSGLNFPDYPKYGVWSDTYALTTREFGPNGEYGIGVFGLEKSKMIRGESARSLSFFVDGNDPALLPLVGDGLLPADVDGRRLPPAGSPIPLAGTQDDDWEYGATSDALNLWNLSVNWRQGRGSLDFAKQLPVAEFNSNFPCNGGRTCLPQPGAAAPDEFLDVLSYRQRPTWRLAYRNFGTHESLVTNQSVEAAPATAGVRWYEVRRRNSNYRLYQQGTYAPADAINRWMGSIAQDRRGNMGLGYSVVNGTDIFPGIRFTGRFADDPRGEMTLQEGTIVNGSGIQTAASRWGDYTSMNIDPVDDCTFWYTNEYFSAEGEPTQSWQTRIASFKLPGC
jgi:hypothetical protein